MGSTPDSAAAPPEDRAAGLLGELRAIVGEGWLYTAEHDLSTYRSDGLLHFKQNPAAVVLPGGAEQVRAVVAACARAGVPWVTNTTHTAANTALRNMAANSLMRAINL